MGFNCLKATELLRGDSFLFTIQFPGFQEFLVLNWSSSVGWKAGLPLEPPSGFEPRTPGLGIKRLKHKATACFNVPPNDVEIISTYLSVWLWNVKINF